MKGKRGTAIIQHSRPTLITSPLPVTPTTTKTVQTTVDLDKLQCISPVEYNNNFKETDESFILPIMRVGPTAYGLMQLVSPTPNTVHLKMLGGDSFVNTTSVTSASLRAASQTFNWTSKALDYFRRPLATAFIQQEQLKSEFRAAYGREITEAEACALMDPLNQPVGVDLAYQLDAPDQHNIVGTHRKLPFPTDRGSVYLHNESRSIARVVSSSIHVKDMPGKSRQLTKQAIHFVDYGAIDPVADRAFDPALISTEVPDALIFPDLFRPYIKTKSENAAQFAAQMASLLMSSRPLVQSMKNLGAHLAINHYYRTKNSKHEKRILNRGHFAPYPSSLYSWQGLGDALNKKVLLDSLAQIVDPTVERSEGLFQTLTGEPRAGVEKIVLTNEMKDAVLSMQNIDFNSIEPQLMAWLLPFFYNQAKPGATPATLFPERLPYADFEPTRRPIPNQQASSLHWVPLHEFLRKDVHLQPFWTRPEEEQFDATRQHLTNNYATHRWDLTRASVHWSNWYLRLQRAKTVDVGLLNPRTLRSDPLKCVEFGTVVTSSMGYVYPMKMKDQELLEDPVVTNYLRDINTKAWRDCFMNPAKEKLFMKRINKMTSIAESFNLPDDTLRELYAKKATAVKQ